MPPDAESGFIEAADGIRLRYGHFPHRAATAKATIIILAGRLSFIEKYYEVIEDLTRRGFSIAMMDFRGQGGSGRPPAATRRDAVSSFEQHVDDQVRFIRTVVRARFDGPYCVMGHSSGGLVAPLAEPLLRPDVARMILVTPMLGLPRLSNAATARLAAVLSAIGLGGLGLGEGRAGFDGNLRTSDPVRYERTVHFLRDHPELATGKLTVAYLGRTSEAIAAVSAAAAKVATRTLFILAGEERVVSTPAILDYAGRVPGSECVTIDGARHDIFQEADIYRDRLLAEIERFAGGGFGTESAEER